jgi:hypothetical protein
MKATDIARSFKRKVGQEVQLEAEGLDRFIVYTPFQFDDGDHYVIVLRKQDGNWVLTDEGHTFMHLSYGEVDISSGTRAKVIDEALANYRVVNDSGELRLAVPGKEFGDALFSFVQALGRIAHTAKWTQDRVRSTFAEDVANLVESTVPFGKVERGYVDPKVDAQGHFPIDVVIDGKDRKWFVFAVSNDTQCQQATIACLRYEGRGQRFSSLVIYDDQKRINRKFVAQLTDVSGKAFSTLSEQERIKKYIEDEILGPSSPSLN